MVVCQLLGLVLMFGPGMRTSALRICTAMCFRYARLALWLIGLFLSLTYLPAHAADWSVVPSLGVGASYDSNINFSFIQKQHDFIFNVTPSVNFNYASEINNLTGHLALNGLAYVRSPELDTINQDYGISGQHQITPRLAFTFNGGYILDSTQNQELITSGFVMNRTRRQSLSAGPGLSYSLTERATLSLGYSYYQTNYQDPRFADYYSHSVSLTFSNQLKNAKTTLTGTILGAYTNSPSINNSYRNLGTYVGLQHQFSDNWKLSVSGGMNYNWYSTETAVVAFGNFVAFVRLPQTKLTTSSVSPNVNISATRQWTKTSLTFGYTIDQVPAASGAINQTHSGYASLTHNFTERLTGGLQGNSYYSPSASPGSNYNSLVFYLTPSLSYQLTEKISVVSSYSYAWEDNLSSFGSFGGGQTTSKSVVWLYLRYSNPLLHYQK